MTSTNFVQAVPAGNVTVLGVVTSALTLENAKKSGNRACFSTSPSSIDACNAAEAQRMLPFANIDLLTPLALRLSNFNTHMALIPADLLGTGAVEGPLVLHQAQYAAPDGATESERSALRAERMDFMFGSERGSLP